MLRQMLLNGIVTAAILLGTHAALAENRLALVIGQSAYRSVPPLSNPANDARAVSKLLADSGFEVLTASDLSQNGMREKVGDFAAKVSAKGPDTVVLVFQAINQTTGHGLTIVDAKAGAPGTFISFSTSPGAESEDGNGADSPYTTALLSVARKPGVSIEDTFKRVRVSVNKATGGRQTPWDSSSLTDDFEFFPGPGAAAPKQVAAKRTVDEWRRELQGKPVEAANEMMVADGTDEAYEAFVGLYAQSPFGPRAREWLDRHRRMVAWNQAVILNTAAGYRAFLARYPDSDLTATARKLEDRLRNRPNPATDANAVVDNSPNAPGPSSGARPLNPAASPAVPTCPCSEPSPQKKPDVPPKKRADQDAPKHVVHQPRRTREYGPSPGGGGYGGSGGYGRSGY